MNKVYPSTKKTVRLGEAPHGKSGLSHPSIITAYRSRGCFTFIIVLMLLFIKPLISLVMHAASVELHSQILLVPFISAYLIYIQREHFPSEYVSFLGAVITASFIGLAALFLALGGGLSPLSENDSLGLTTFSFLSFLVAGGFYFLGRKWMMAVAFPIGFLIFMVPLPDAIVEWFETGSKLGSAEVANWFFHLTGTPVLRDTTVFQLPGIVIEVAQECSGIRSSWVLFVTSLLASYMFLKSPWRRTVLVLLVIPLGLIRNGFRILVIGLLCVHIGPHMIHHMIHRKGGPFFFVLSLIPLFLLLWWLRKGEVKKSLRDEIKSEAVVSN